MTFRCDASSITTPARPTSRARGGGKGHHGGDLRRVGSGPVVADILEFEHRLRLPDHECDQLPDVERRPAADRKHAVVSAPAKGLDPGGDIGPHRVGPEIGEDGEVDILGRESFHQRCHWSKIHQSGIGDHQRSADSGTPARVGSFVDPPAPEADFGGIGPCRPGHLRHDSRHIRLVPFQRTHHWGPGSIGPRSGRSRMRD